MNQAKLLVGILLFLSISLTAQNTVSGKILSADDQLPLIGANVIIEGTAEGTVSDLDGNFSFETNRSYPIQLVISYVGHSTMNVVVESNNPISIQLASGSLFTDEVII